MRGVVVLSFLLMYGTTFGQPEPVIRGVSVYAMNNEESFPMIVRDSVANDGKPVGIKAYITIQFDVLASDPPPLKIRFHHCNRDWRVDENSLVQDENHNTSFVLDYRTSPNSIQHYNYRYVNRFPDAADAVRFDYSGNWAFRILDKEERTVYAEGRFIVADRIAPTRVRVVNDYLAEGSSPLNQIQRVVVDVRLPDEIDGYYYTTVDVYQNRKLGNPYRIDAHDRDSYTVVEGYNTGSRVFNISNIHPGNEYRILDLSNVTRYPNRALVRRVEGADQQRQYWRTGQDRNGIATLNRFAGVNSDYLEVLFRLDLTDTDHRSVTHGGREIFVVGPFNHWMPTLEDRLVYDEMEKSLVARRLLRRGIYDYQYVTGRWDAVTGTVFDQDWLVLEGNDWRTSNTYHAFVYYNDPRFGGFDRIVGFGTAISSPVLPGSH